MEGLKRKNQKIHTPWATETEPRDHTENGWDNGFEKKQHRHQTVWAKLLVLGKFWSQGECQDRRLHVRGKFRVMVLIWVEAECLRKAGVWPPKMVSG